MLHEVSYVKRAVGRDRIQRNKDALRELRCLQEITFVYFARDSSKSFEQIHERHDVETAQNIEDVDACGFTILSFDCMFNVLIHIFGIYNFALNPEH